MAATDVLARLAKSVLLDCQADDALARTLFSIIPVRVETIGFFNRKCAKWSDNLLLNEANLRRCNAEFEVDQSRVAVVHIRRVRTLGLNDERKVPASLVAHGSSVAEVGEIYARTLELVRTLSIVHCEGGWLSCVVIVDLVEGNVTS